jgi:hypothetical protein
MVLEVMCYGLNKDDVWHDNLAHESLAHGLCKPNDLHFEAQHFVVSFSYALPPLALLGVGLDGGVEDQVTTH